MRSRINARDGLVTIEAHPGAVRLRIEHSDRTELEITLDTGIAALMAGEVERAVWRAQQLPRPAQSLGEEGERRRVGVGSTVSEVCCQRCSQAGRKCQADSTTARPQSVPAEHRFGGIGEAVGAGIEVHGRATLDRHILGGGL